MFLTNGMKHVHSKMEQSESFHDLNLLRLHRTTALTKALEAVMELVKVPQLSAPQKQSALFSLVTSNSARFLFCVLRSL